MNDDQLLRYSRQVMLPQVDIEGQKKLLASRVLIIGMGGLGSPVAMYLAAAGVGHLVLVDDDKVELSNLQRQIAHGTSDINSTKVESAKQTIKDLNPEIKVTLYDRRLDNDELSQEIKLADVVVDGIVYTLAEALRWQYEERFVRANEVIDELFSRKLNNLVKNVTMSFESYEYSKARAIVEDFFWHDFCDNYLETVKTRVYQNKKGKESAQYVLYKSLLTILKIIAPIMPFITEEIYQTYFKKQERTFYEFGKRPIYPIIFHVGFRNESLYF